MRRALAYTIRVPLGTAVFGEWRIERDFIDREEVAAVPRVVQPSAGLVYLALAVVLGSDADLD